MDEEYGCAICQDLAAAVCTPSPHSPSHPPSSPAKPSRALDEPSRSIHPSTRPSTHAHAHKHARSYARVRTGWGQAHSLECGHHFCGGCIHDWLRRSRKCPHCRMFPCVCTRARACVRVYAHVCSCVCMCTYIQARMHVCVCIHVCARTCTDVHFFREDEMALGGDNGA